jgi:RNA recognition motif-containing protein
VYSIEWAQNLDKSHITAPPMPKIPIDYTSIFIGQLDRSTDEIAIRERFSAYGIVLNVQVFSKPTTMGKKPGGFAFVKYESREGASRAVKAEVCPL